MDRATVDIIEGAIVVGIAVASLVAPGLFTKMDLTAQENRGAAKTLRRCGWLALAAGAVFLSNGTLKVIGVR
jgi:hypothetical protein